MKIDIELLLRVPAEVHSGFPMSFHLQLLWHSTDATLAPFETHSFSGYLMCGTEQPAVSKAGSCK